MSLPLDPGSERFDPGARPVEPGNDELAFGLNREPLAEALPISVGEPPASTAPVALVPIPEVRDVHDLDWRAVAAAVDPQARRAGMRATVEAIEGLLDRYEGPGLLFDPDRAGSEDRAIKITTFASESSLWIVGDLHGDLLALEAALALIGQDPRDPKPRIVFLGDLFDDEGLGLETLLRLFELVIADPERVCLLAGNHDEALSYDGSRFASSVSPGDFAEFLNANLAHEWIVRAGKVAVRLIRAAPRALFFPDGLLVAHAGFPLVDTHAQLQATGDWNDPTCLSDFVWARAHPKARRKMPNRHTRGSQFGFEDFADFCALSSQLGRPITHMVRGHDHVEERYVVHPAYRAHPILTTVALSRRLPRESFGPAARVPTVARYLPGSLPQVHRLHIPADIIATVFPATSGSDEAKVPFP